MKKLENYVLVFSKRLDLKKANRVVEDFKEYYLKKGLKIYYRIVEEGNPGGRPAKPQSHHSQCPQRVVFFRDIDEEDTIYFRDELKLKRKLPGLRLYRNELIIGKKEVL